MVLGVSSLYWFLVIYMAKIALEAFSLHSCEVRLRDTLLDDTRSRQEVGSVYHLCVSKRCAIASMPFVHMLTTQNQDTLTNDLRPRYAPGAICFDFGFVDDPCL